MLRCLLSALFCCCLYVAVLILCPSLRSVPRTYASHAARFPPLGVGGLGAGEDGASTEVELYFDESRVNEHGDRGTWLLRKSELLFQAGDQTDLAGGFSTSDVSRRTAPSSGVQLFDNRTVYPLGELEQRRQDSGSFHPLPCLDSAKDWDDLAPFVGNGRRSNPFTPRYCTGDAAGGGSRGPRTTQTPRCGRMVFDGVLSEALVQEASELPTTYNWPMLAEWRGFETIKNLLEKNFHTPPLMLAGGKLDRDTDEDLPCELHSDFLSQPPYYFLTAIIYLVDQGKDCER